MESFFLVFNPTSTIFQVSHPRSRFASIFRASLFFSFVDFSVLFPFFVFVFCLFFVQVWLEGSPSWLPSPGPQCKTVSKYTYMFFNADMLLAVVGSKRYYNLLLYLRIVIGGLTCQGGLAHLESLVAFVNFWWF